jgi:hypothetical protein
MMLFLLHAVVQFSSTVINSQQQLSESNSSAELSDTTANLWSRLFGSGAITAAEPHTVDDDLTDAPPSHRMSILAKKNSAGSYHAIPPLDTAASSADESATGSSHSTPLGGTRAGSDIFYNVSHTITVVVYYVVHNCSDGI